MDLSRQLKTAIASGTLLFGQRQALDNLFNRESKIDYPCSQRPEDYINEIHAKHPEVAKFRAQLVNRELGISCVSHLLYQPSL